MTTVLLTGATGFVGRQIATGLAARGAEVVPVVRAATPAAPSARVCTDLFSETDDALRDLCAGVDVVVHAAWYVVPGLYIQASANFDCLIGTLRLARAAVTAGVRRFVGLGTCLEYAASDEPLSTLSPLSPVSPYATAKMATYVALSGWLPSVKTEFAWCRLFYLHGDGERPGRLFPYVRTCLEAGVVAKLGRGDVIRDYIDVADAGAMIADVALGDGRGAFNVCSGQRRTLRSYIEDLARPYGRPDLLEFGAKQFGSGEPTCVVGIPGQQIR